MPPVIDLTELARELRVKFFVSSPPPYVKYPYILIHVGPAEKESRRKRRSPARRSR